MDRRAIQIHCLTDQSHEFETIDAFNARAVGQGKGDGQPVAPLAGGQRGKDGKVIGGGSNAQLASFGATDQRTAGARRTVQVAVKPATGGRAQGLDLRLVLDLGEARSFRFGGVEGRGAKAADDVRHTQAGQHAAIHRIGRKIARDAEGEAAAAGSGEHLTQRESPPAAAISGQTVVPGSDGEHAQGGLVSARRFAHKIAHAVASRADAGEERCPGHGRDRRKSGEQGGADAPRSQASQVWHLAGLHQPLQDGRIRTIRTNDQDAAFPLISHRSSYSSPVLEIV